MFVDKAGTEFELRPLIEFGWVNVLEIF